MSELKPCPFCGGEAETLTAESMHGGYLFGIMCSDCCSRGDVYETEAEAVAAWNTRHVETCTIGDYKDHDYGYTHDAMWNDEWFMPSGRCSGCGEYIPVWNYCPKCGRKVVDE